MSHTRSDAGVVRPSGVLHHARAEFGAHSSSVNAALMFVHEHLVAWSMRDRIPVASTVVNVFAENALTYTYGGFEVRLEGTDTEVAIAVSDRSSAPAVRRERAVGSRLSGLDIVAALCQRWGSTPTSTGKTVWARLGPHDTFHRHGRTRVLGGVVKDQAECIPLAGSYDGQAVPHRGCRPATY